MLVLLAFAAMAAAQTETYFGVTAAGEPMRARVVTPDARIVVVAGLDGAEESIRTAERLSGVTVLLHKFPRDFASPFPPPGEAYAGPHGEAHYLWRFLGLHAPDLVVVLNTNGSAAPGRLAEELARQAPAGMGTIPAEVSDGRSGFLDAIRRRKPAASPARQELRRRLARTPATVARQLAQHYGHALEEAVYIPAMALWGRVRLGEVGDVEKIVAPYYDHERPAFGAKLNSSHLAGHLLFGELFRATGKARYLELSRAAADQAFEPGGAMKEAMPLHNEMSDAVFMGCPILAQTGRLTGDAKYFDMALRHLRFMLRLNLRRDGLHRHSPLDEAAWGRGNGFPALGVALALSDLPAGSAAHSEFLAAFRAHMAALLPHQDAGGAWHQVIDRPQSYAELTSTAMITFAMARGIARGWIERARYRPAVVKGWEAVKRHTGLEGGMVDVCASTGKQKSLREYYDRPAVLGADARGGAMVLLLATELEQLRY